MKIYIFKIFDKFLSMSEGLSNMHCGIFGLWNMTWLIQYMDSSKTTTSKNETAGIWIKIFLYQKLCLNTEKYMMLKNEQRGKNVKKQIYSGD